VVQLLLAEDVDDDLLAVVDLGVVSLNCDLTRLQRRRGETAAPRAS